MKIKPGINQYKVADSSSPALSMLLIQPEKKMRKTINTNVINTLIRKDDEATDIFSFKSSLPLTYLICAFFKSPLLVASKTEVTVKNKAQVPISAVLNARARMIKFIRPKKVSENRCSML